MRTLILLCCALSASFAHASILNKCGLVFIVRKPTPHQLMVRAWDEAARQNPKVREILKNLRRSEIDDGLEALHSVLIGNWRHHSVATFMAVSQLVLRFEMIPGQHTVVKDANQLLRKLNTFAMFLDLNPRDVKTLLATAHARLSQPWPDHLLNLGWGEHYLRLSDVHDSHDIHTATAETFALHFQRRMIEAHLNKYGHQPDKELLNWVSVVKEAFTDTLAGGSKMSGSEFAKAVHWIVNNDNSYNHQSYPNSTLATRSFTAHFKTKFLGVTLRAIADAIPLSFNDKFQVRQALTQYAVRLEQTREFANYNPSLRGIGNWADGVQTLDIWEPTELTELHQFWSISQTELSDKLKLLIDDLVAPRWGK